MAGRPELLARLFAQVADLETSDHRREDHLLLICQGICDVCAVDDAGVLEVGDGGEPYVAAATSEAAERAHQTQLRMEEGPCVDCYRRGESFAAGNLSELGRWPRFVGAAASLGYVAVQALPMKTGDDTVAAVNLLNTTAGPLSGDDLEVANAVVAVGGAAIWRHDELEQRDRSVERLQTALDSRIVIEQAKGLVSGELGVELAEAFAMLRRYAQGSGLDLHEVALSVIRARTGKHLEHKDPPG